MVKLKKCKEKVVRLWMLKHWNDQDNTKAENGQIMDALGD